MAPPLARTTQHTIRFGLSPSMGPEAAGRAPLVERFFARVLGKMVEVSVAQSYDALGKDVLSGKLDAAWAPPFVCARLEAMGTKVAARGVRRGSAVYRGALVCRASRPLTMERLEGARAAWVDRDSVSGYLLPLALLRTHGLDPNKVFFSQEFLGSFRAGVEAVLAEKADVASVYAAPVSAGVAEEPSATGLEEILPGKSAELKVIAFTDEAPNDGLVCSMTMAPELMRELEKATLEMHASPDGAELLKDVFHAEKFEPAPRLGYRSLYRVALATL
ncbi:MAG TPA: PhnD/SsuA/transferrin family substrate-binding protein [Myxococcaceae bacterium]|jgi:phosphonate transport system substrate-binding protein